MKKIVIILLTVFTAIESICAQDLAKAVTLVDSSGETEQFGDDWISIPEGYIVTVKNWVIKSTSSSEPSTIRIHGESVEGAGDFEISISEDFPSSFELRFVGPGEVRCQAGGFAGSFAIANLEIEKIGSDIATTPQNSVVVPSDVEGEVEIILEASEDLVNWVRVDPGFYGSTTENRFFRVRAEQQP